MSTADFAMPPIPVRDILERLRRCAEDLSAAAAASPDASALADALEKVRGACADLEGVETSA